MAGAPFAAPPPPPRSADRGPCHAHDPRSEHTTALRAQAAGRDPAAPPVDLHVDAD